MARVDFDAPDLAAQLDALSGEERDALPFGVILLDRDGVVRFYSKTEERISKYPGEKVGHNFFDMAKRISKDELWNSIQRAMDTQGKVDLDFGWVGDHADPKRQFRLRVQSAKNGGVWLAFERDPEQPSGAAA
jgi:photoactive yellow protein